MAFSINENCNGCSACFTQCPTRAISGEFTVRYSVDVRACIDCGVCGYICPVDAVDDAQGNRAQRVVREERPHPVVEVDLCNACGSCVDICPMQCRQLIGTRYYGSSYLADPLRCISCGDCTRVCIKECLSMQQIDFEHDDPRVGRQV